MDLAQAIYSKNA